MFGGEALEALASKGSTAPRPGSLGGLAQARRTHQGQFWTSVELAAFVWRMVEPAMDAALLARPGRRIAVFDNGVGSGRLLRAADPDKHSIYGIDVDPACIEALGECARAGGFTYRFAVGSMAAAQPRGMDVCLVNPPFSVHMEDPRMQPLGCTTFGKFGPSTSALSHAYALEQALMAGAIVAAILPKTYIDGYIAARPDRRLAAVLDLPGGLFVDEGTSVSVGILLFDIRDHRSYSRLAVGSLLESVQAVGLTIPARYGDSHIRMIGEEASEPAIRMAVTGNDQVRVVHDGRRIGLRFSCGLVMAKVLNVVLKQPLDAVRMPSHRYPVGLEYDGQYRLDVEAYLVQDDPAAAFGEFLRLIARAGGSPVVDDSLAGYLRKRIREKPRALAPFGHVIRGRNGEHGAGAEAKLQPKATEVLDRLSWTSPVVAPGDTLAARRLDTGAWRVEHQGYRVTLEDHELRARFTVVGNEVATGWTVAYPSVEMTYPTLGAHYRARAKRLGIDKWLGTWSYQLDDAVELLIKPQGGIAAWTVGLGKTRLALGLVLLSGVKRALIAVHAYLAPEFIGQIKALGISEDDWQLIDSPGALGSLRKINLIAYSRLRMAVDPARPKITYAKRLRRRISLLIADEGELLASQGTDQSRALWTVSAKRKFLLAATPIASYPRDILAPLAFVGGDGTAIQPYGLRHPFMEPMLLTSAISAQRGLDRFADRFVTTRWVTAQFQEDLRTGGKREVPVLRNVPAYRKAICAFVKRRLEHEPEVARHFQIPEPSYRVLEVPWHDDHLAHYLRTAEDFAEFFRRAKDAAGSKALNLVTVLARINAVEIAANCPGLSCKNGFAYRGHCSKSDFAVRRLLELAGTGDKTVLFAEHPESIERIARALRTQGIDPVVVHGSIPIEERTREMNERFRFGDCPTMLATKGTTQAGLNLPEANRAILLDRSWLAKTERQAIGRLLRPQQKRDVFVEYLHLPGAICQYQAQMVAFKSDAAAAGLDWGDDQDEEMEFAHVDTILGRFVDDLAGMLGVMRHDVRAVLAGQKCVETCDVE